MGQVDYELPGKLGLREAEQDGLIIISILQRFGVCAAEIGPDMTLVRSNSCFEACVKAGDGGLTLRTGILSASEEGDADHLRSSVTRACLTDPGGVISLARDNKRRQVYMRVLPLHGARDQPRHALLLFRDPDRPRADLIRVLKQTFGLSAAEVEIAVELAGGAELSEIAAERGVRLTTVRSQLASLMSKTQTKRQAQLVALLARLESALV